MHREPRSACRTGDSDYNLSRQSLHRFRTTVTIGVTRIQIEPRRRASPSRRRLGRRRAQHDTRAPRTAHPPPPAEVRIRASCCSPSPSPQRGMTSGDMHACACMHECTLALACTNAPTKVHRHTQPCMSARTYACNMHQRCSRARIRMRHTHATRSQPFTAAVAAVLALGGEETEGKAIAAASPYLPTAPPRRTPPLPGGSPARIAAIGSPDDCNSAVCRFSCTATGRKPRRDRDQRIWLGECGAGPSVLSASLRRGGSRSRCGVPAQMWALRTETQRNAAQRACM